MGNLQTVAVNAESTQTVASEEGTSETRGSTTSSVAQTPLTPDERVSMMGYLQGRMGLNQEQANQFMDDVMQPDEVRQFLTMTSGQQPLTAEQMKAQWNLNDEEIDFVLEQQEQSPTGEPAANRNNHFGGVYATSSPFGNHFVEFMALMYSLGVEVKQMMSKLVQQKKDIAISAANDQFKGAIATFAASMAAGVVSVGLAGANLFRTKTKPPAESAAGAQGAAKAGGEPTKPGGAGSADDAAAAAAREQRNSLLNEALNNTWTSPNGIGLITQPITAGGQFIEANFQRNSALNQAEVQEAEAIYQQLATHYQQTLEASQAAKQGLR